MKNIIRDISNKEYNSATEAISEALSIILEKKMVEMKKMIMAKEQNPNMDSEAETNKLAEEDLDEARIKIVKARVRGGKVQRRKKVSNVAGYTFRGGQLKRMSPMERRKRKLGQRRGKIKRRAKLQRSLVKRKRSLRKRQSIGLK